MEPKDDGIRNKVDCDRCIERIKAELLVELSHEFRTPLTLVLGPLADVSSGRHGELPAAAREQIALAWRNAERLRGTVERILDAAALDVEPELIGAAARAPAPAPAPVEQGSPLDADPAAVGSEADRTTVLVIDDQSDIRLFLRGHLEPRYRVVEAADGAEGLAMARELLPDLVVSDVMMPEMDGFALCRALKQDPELDWVPVVLLTARATLDDKLVGLGGGADAYLTKPCDARELVARIDNLIASRRQLERRFAVEPSRPALPLAPGVQPVNGDREWLEEVAGAIEAGLDEEAFSVEILAERLAVHRTQLFRRLRELTGLSPARLILRRRLERAAAHLSEDGATVSQAAYAAGFHSVAHFSRRFHDLYGRSPSAWRRRATR